MPPISVMIKPSSGMCNMVCDYCFYCDETQKRLQESYGFMTEATLKNVIRRTMLKAEGAVSYVFQGGEPSLRGLRFYQQAIAYQKQYQKNGIRISNSFQTNGYELDQRLCRFLKDHHFLVGVSLDGTKELHNSFRHSKNGADTYDKILHTIELFQRSGVEYNILTVVNGESAQHAAEIYRSYRSLGFRYQQYIACLDPLGEQHGITGCSLKPKQYGKFLTELFDLWYQDWKQNAQPYIRQFDNYIGILLGYQPESCDMRGTCGIQYVVEADGSVYPCDFYMLDEYRLGNFNENRLEEIDAKRNELLFLKKSEQLEEACIQCSYYKLCRGGCQRNRDYQESTGGWRNYFCEGYRMFFDACLGRMKEIADTLRRK